MKALASRAPDFTEPASRYFRRKEIRRAPEARAVAIIACALSSRGQGRNRQALSTACSEQRGELEIIHDVPQSQLGECQVRESAEAERREFGWMDGPGKGSVLLGHQQAHTPAIASFFVNPGCPVCTLSL